MLSKKVRIIFFFLCFLFQSLKVVSVEKKQFEKECCRTENVIRIGCNAAYAPFHFLNHKQQPDGLAVDLTKEIMQRLELSYNIKIVLEEDLYHKFDQGEFDLLLDVSISNRKNKNYLYTVPLSYGYSTFYVLKDSNYQGIASLRAKKIALPFRSKKWFNPIYFKLEKLELIYTNALYSIRLLLSGNVNAIFVDRELMEYYRKKYALGDRIVPLSASYNVHPNRILLHSKDSLLQKKIDTTLYEMQKDGTFRKYQKKWLKYFSNPQYSEVLLVVLFVALSIFIILFIIIIIYRERAIKMSKEDQRMNQVFDKMLDALPLSVIIKKVENNYSEAIYWNKQAEAKYTLDWIKKGGKGYLDEKLYNKSHRLEWEVIKTSELSIDKEAYKLPNGKKVIEQVIRALYYDDVLPCVVVISLDITELEEERMKAQVSDYMKSAFLANISHDIRTPLNAIAGFSELLAETEDAEERMEYMNIIEINKDLLLTLINEIVNFSQLKTDSMPFYKTWVDVNQLLYRIETMFNKRLKGKNVKMEHLQYYEKIEIETDPDRMLQIAINIVGNAVKYTLKGSIRMGVFLEKDSFYFFVHDTGIGIPEEKKEKVFVRFEKLDNVAKGTGLGMAICKAIAEKLGGNMDFISKEGVGSIFWFSMRVKCKVVPVKKVDDTLLSEIKEQILTRNYRRL